MPFLTLQCVFPGSKLRFALLDESAGVLVTDFLFVDVHELDRYRQAVGSPTQEGIIPSIWNRRYPNEVMAGLMVEPVMFREMGGRIHGFGEATSDAVTLFQPDEDNTPFVWPTWRTRFRLRRLYCGMYGRHDSTTSDGYLFCTICHQSLSPAGQALGYHQPS